MDTERASPRFTDIDRWEPGDILDALIESQLAAVAAVRGALPAIQVAAAAMQARLSGTGRLIYVGAGTSGRLAVQDGAELFPTFNWPPERLLLLMAGGKDALLRSAEGAEDQIDEAARLIRYHRIEAEDVIIAVAASGTTPFTLACMREAKQRGAFAIGIDKNHSTPQHTTADFQAVSAKRIGRSQEILRRLSGRGEQELRDALDRAGGNVKTAMLILHGCTPDKAASLMQEAGGQLRIALQLAGGSSE